MFSLERFLQGVIFISLLGIVLVLFQSGASSTGIIVFSNDYRYPGAEDVVSFDQPQTFRQFFSDLQKNRSDFYSFNASKGVFLKAKLEAARLVGQDNFRPSLALFGPGLPVPSKNEAALLPFTLPPNVGLILSEPELETTELVAEHSIEPWTQADFWHRQSILTELPESGNYFLVVFGRKGQTGKYALNVGDTSETGLREIVSFPVTWARVRYWFNDLWWPSFASGLFGLVVLWLIVAYARTWQKSLRTVKYKWGNQRRARLFPKRIGRWQSRRIEPKVNWKWKVKFPAAESAFEQNVPAEIGTGWEKTVKAAYRTEENLLLGEKWEVLPEVKSLPAGVTKKYEYNSISKEVSNNGGSAKTSQPDGLEAWGRRMQPKN